jgi:hypothetical protein
MMQRLHVAWKIQHRAACLVVAFCPRHHASAGLHLVLASAIDAAIRKGRAQ